MELPIHVVITEPLEKQILAHMQGISPRLDIHLFPAKHVEDLPADVLESAEVLYTLQTVPQPDQAPNLKWVQFHLAGLDRFADHPLLNAGVQFTSLSGAAAPQMAEFVLLMLLALGHHLPEIQRAQNAHEWGSGRWERFSPRELRGSVVGIIGYGSVGREVARLCRSFGARILAVKRDVTRPEDLGFTLPGFGDPEGRIPLRLYPPAALKRMLAECDFVVVSAPLHPGTLHLLNADAFAAMRPGAYLVNVARGGIVQEEALCEALINGRLAGAALDVTEQEPLPPDSPLWTAPNLVLSPHIAGDSSAYERRAADVFMENLQRYLEGRPLINRFDPAIGY